MSSFSNIANLLLARAAGRRREIGIRLTLGASRLAPVRQLLLESLVVALAGGLLGLLVASWTTEALLHILPRDTGGGWLSAQVDSRLLGFNLPLSLFTGLLFGLAPAVQAARPDVAPALREQSANLASSGGLARFRRILVVAQVSLSLLLLIGAGLFARSLVNLMSVDPGFRPERLITFSVDPRLSGYTASRAFAFYRELQERLAALPGVLAAGAANPGPLSGSERGGNITVEGYRAKEDEYVGARMNAVSPGYFRAVGIPLIAGREFAERDEAGAPKVVVVNEAFVERYFAGRTPMGRRMYFGAGNRITLNREIVGVVRNNKHAGLRERVRPAVYFPYTQDDKPDWLNFYVRTARNENEMAPEIRRVVRQMDAEMPIFGVKSMQLRGWRNRFTGIA